MRTSNLLALSFLVAGGCSAELGSGPAHDEALAVSPDLVIAQAYGGGGNSGSVYKNDYVVLFNRGASPISLSGYSIYYQSATATAASWTSKTTLPASTLQPGQSFLVAEAAGAAGTMDLPTPDVVGGTINLSGTGGEVAVAQATPGTDPSTWTDMVGWGSAKINETASAAATTNTTAIVRKSSCVDTGDNATDFETQTATPVNSASAIVACDSDGGSVDMQPDLTPVVDMVVTDAGPFTALLNEVKFNPVKTDDGQEFIELIGSGTLPPHTFVVSVSGDAENPKGSSVGVIDYAYDVSATPFGSNGLILIQAAATTFPNVPAATKLLLDPALNTAKLGNFTETAMLIQVNDPVATPIKTGGTIPATTAYTILDSLAVREPVTTDGGTAGMLDPIYGAAVLEACASELPGKVYPPSGASRIVGNLTADSASAWYAGQAYGTVSSDQYLSNVADCSTAAGAPQTWSQSPGLPNDMPFQAIPDLLNAPIVDLSTPATGDLAVSGGDDLSADVPDLSHAVPTTDGGSTIKPGGTIGGSGCAEGGHGAVGWPAALLVLGLAGLLRSRRRA